MAAAMYKELQEPGPIQSLGFIRELDRLHQTGHDNRLPDVLLNFKLQAPVPIHYEDIGLTQSHPTLRLRSFIETFNKTQGKIHHLLVGNGPAELRSFWRRYRKLHPKHDIFTDHADHLHACVPMMLHLDEGTSHKKKGLMVLSVQPVCGRGSSRSSGVNFLGSTYCTRFLYSALLARTYTRKKRFFMLCWITGRRILMTATRMEFKSMVLLGWTKCFRSSSTARATGQLLLRLAALQGII